MNSFDVFFIKGFTVRKWVCVHWTMLCLIKGLFKIINEVWASHVLIPKFTDVTVCWKNLKLPKAIQANYFSPEESFLKIV